MTSEELLREENDNLIDSDEMVDTIDSDDVIELEENDLKMGLIFKNEEAAVKSIHLWSEKTFCPLAKVSLYFHVSIL
jgi:hypothetical protein